MTEWLLFITDGYGCETRGVALQPSAGFWPCLTNIFIFVCSCVCACVCVCVCVLQVTGLLSGLKSAAKSAGAEELAVTHVLESRVDMAYKHRMDSELRRLLTFRERGWKYTYQYATPEALAGAGFYYDPSA
jgi:hypothetical protein